MKVYRHHHNQLSKLFVQTLISLLFAFFLSVQVVISLPWSTLWRLWSSLVCESALLQAQARVSSPSTTPTQKTVLFPRWGGGIHIC